MPRTPAPPKDKPPVEDPPPDPKGGPPDDDDGDDDDGEITRGELREMVAELVAEVVKPAPKGEDQPAPKGKRTAADDEDDMRKRVESEVARIRKDDEVLGRIAKVEEAVKVTEEPPRKPRWLERIFWS